jgi:lipid-A-disaccharide synthase
MVYRLKYIGMPNIVLNKPVIPELVQSDCTSFNLLKYTEKVFEEYAQVKEGLREVGEFFPDTDASVNAAEEISSFMEKIAQEKTAS